MIERIRRILIYVVTAVMAACSDVEPLPAPDFTRSGEPMTVGIGVQLPEMEVESRAALSDFQLNSVRSLWIATYNAVTGEITSRGSNGGWLDVTDQLPTADTEVLRPFTIESKSGPSYIVAVANVDNQGFTASNRSPQSLRALLTAADTWEKFLAIAVSVPATQNLLVAPESPITMVGCYTNATYNSSTGQHTNPTLGASAWQREDFMPYNIPYSSDNVFTMQGAIHLRRPVAHVTFNIKSGNPDVKITPNSYRIVNAPRYSWLYERPTDAEHALTANFGDQAKEENRGDYYYTSSHFNSSFISSSSGGTYSFDYWQGENKHTGNAATYRDRDKEAAGGIFPALTGSNDAWTANNMATYVMINCSVEHLGLLRVDEDGVPGSATGLDVHRSGTATYIIHLGYVGANPNDFNCYRNVDYTYNVTINGLEDIRVEAFNGEETPGVEGIVTDIYRAPYSLDCHYHAFNIELNDDELAAWSQEGGTSRGFGFILSTYDNLNGGEKRYEEVDFIGMTYDQYIAAHPAEKKYLDWVELAPTTSKSTLALYKPRGATGSKTFNLIDASKGIRADQKSAVGIYTVFVNEYTYEADGCDERVTVNGQPLWHSYVNADPRRFYIRVTRSVSPDGESIYARSKYAGNQKSIMTYYSDEKAKGSAIGLEHDNELFGMNMRQSYNPAAADYKTVNNGRHNTYIFSQRTYNGNGGWNGVSGNGRWDYFVQPSVVQEIYMDYQNKQYPIQPQTVANDNPVLLPKLYPYRGTFTNSNGINNTATEYDPQPNAPTNAASKGRYYIEAINSCMNRNRDNNGNGIIDPEELRWFVPAGDTYIRMVIGANSLTPPVMDYEGVTALPYKNRTCYNGAYLFYGSNQRILWAMEGYSQSNWTQYDAVPTWQVRCVRNLGTNLATITKNDAINMAYTTETNSAGRTVVRPTYYMESNLRPIPYEGNGTGATQMPVHSVANKQYNSIYRHGFELYGYAGSFQRANVPTWGQIKTHMESPTLNPCNALGDRWRLPNISELAIIQALGKVTNTFTTSCSMGAFAKDGYQVTPSSDLASDHLYLGSTNDHVYQLAELKQVTHFYFYCVRDVLTP